MTNPFKIGDEVIIDKKINSVWAGTYKVEEIHGNSGISVRHPKMKLLGYFDIKGIKLKQAKITDWRKKLETKI